MALLLPCRLHGEGVCVSRAEHSLGPGNRPSKRSRSWCPLVLLILAASPLGVPSGNFTKRASIISALVGTCCSPVVQHPSGFWSISALVSVALPSSLPCSSYSHCYLPLALDHLPKCCQSEGAGSGSLFGSGLQEDVQRATWSTSLGTPSEMGCRFLHSRWLLVGVLCSVESHFLSRPLQ